MFDMQATMFSCGGMTNRSGVRKEAFHGIRFDASVEQIRKTPKACVSLSGPKNGMAAAIERIVDMRDCHSRF